MHLAGWAYAQSAGEVSPAEPKGAISAENALLRQFQLDNPAAQEHSLSLVSEAYQEDKTNPALQLGRLWVGESGTLLELRGLARRGQKYSALINVDTLTLLNLKTGKPARYLASDGGIRFEDRDEKKVLRVLPDDLIYLFFEPIDGLQAHSLQYKNSLGRNDSYFDRIDPRFRERYDQMYARAMAGDAKVEDMKDFLLGFVRQDPDKRVQKVFVSLIGKLRGQKTFDGYYQAYVLIKDPADEKEAQKLVQTEEQRARLEIAVAAAKQAEAAKLEEQKRAAEARQAELRKREEARQADLRRQDEVRQAEQRAAQARADEERCLKDARCRQAMAERQAICEQKILSCRRSCDSAVGSGNYGSFFANLAAAGMARTCYVGCKCDSGFGDLLAKFNQMAADGASSSGSSASPKGRETATKASPSVPPPRQEDAIKVFMCKVYCLSGSGPVTYKRIEASSRKDAAKIASDYADGICAADGKSYASSIRYDESQCKEK